MTEIRLEGLVFEDPLQVSVGAWHVPTVNIC